MPGEVAEWSIAAVLKTVEGQTSGGSNPSLSAEVAEHCLGIFFTPTLSLCRFSQSRVALPTFGQQINPNNSPYFFGRPMALDAHRLPAYGTSVFLLVQLFSLFLSPLTAFVGRRFSENGIPIIHYFFKNNSRKLLQGTKMAVLLSSERWQSGRVRRS